MGWGWDYVRGLASRADQLGDEAVRGAESAWNSTVQGFDKAGKWLEEHPGMAAAVRPQGTNGRDIYLMFHGPEATGTGSIDSSVVGWRRVSDYHKEAGEALTSAMTKLGVAWQGATAESASASVERLREAADTAGRQALHAGTVLEAQSSGWNDTAHKVTDVPADPPRMSLAQADPVTPALSQAQATTYAAGQQANQRALSSYGVTTGTNTQEIPQFTAPARGVGGQQSGSAGSGDWDAGSMPGTPGTAHNGQPTAGSGGSPMESTVDGDRPAATHSAWQLPDVMPHPAGGQTTPQEQAIPVAGAVAGAAGLIAGGSAVMGLTGAVAGSDIGARLAGGGSGPGAGGSSGTGGLPDEESADSRSAGATGGSGAPGTRGKKEQGREHDAPDYLVEANPQGVFGQGRQVAPAVLGEDPAPVEGSVEGD